ncbi:GNAT family N-acetyltransferase [Vibrio alfacsensis]|uniref:GNAT family N-acetyltransferase n=1 Tax=Vibrio alfacsensis TaxID=1074311 RepID=A0ABM6YXH6_9VIBR|nr:MULTISPECIES: GNAT family N-acetyltransferase [Vibrio]AXY02562.1 GNAT family N-acetyltransferase [Vibrio alfacsensis]CAE6933786.1 Acetyltransferase (GNAT) domain [Vibrio sp. B1REV9]
MQIRPIKIEDIDQFIVLWNRVYEEGEYLRSPAPEQSKVTEVLTRVEKESIPQFVAFDEQHLVGSVEIFPASMCGYEGEEFIHTGILGIHIDHQYRNKGLGKQLLAIAIQHGWDYGFDTIMLNVYKHNLPAIALYERFNFEHCGELGVVTLANGKRVMSQKMELKRCLLTRKF